MKTILLLGNRIDRSTMENRARFINNSGKGVAIVQIFTGSNYSVLHPDESNENNKNANMHLIRMCDEILVMDYKNIDMDKDTMDLIEYATDCGKIVKFNLHEKCISPTKNDNLVPSTWDEFMDTGLLLYINQILHAFGFAITAEKEKKKYGGKIIKVIPYKTKYRGFSQSSIDNSYLKIAKYMNENSNNLLKDVE